MYVTAVPKIESYLGTIERYETMYADDPMTARATPKQAHDIVVKNLPINLETLHKTGLFSDIRLYNREGVKLYSSLETPSISPKETLERKLNRKVSGKEIQPTLERIEQKWFKINTKKPLNLKQFNKMESLRPPTPPIRGHWNIHTENSGRKPNNYWAIKLVVRFFLFSFLNFSRLISR